MNEPFFDDYTPNTQALKNFGFVECKDGLIYSTLLNDDQMQLEITIRNSTVQTKIIDLAFGDEFTRHHVKQETGSFVSSIRRDYLTILTEIRDNCFSIDGFVSPDALFVKTHLREKYGNELEYLWKHPDGAAVRRSDTRKWYGCFMRVARKKVDTTSNSDDIVEVMNLHMKADDSSKILDFKSIFPGFHMNKKYWFSVILDGTVPHTRLTELIQMSYELAKK